MLGTCTTGRLYLQTPKDPVLLTWSSMHSLRLVRAMAMAIDTQHCSSQFTLVPQAPCCIAGRLLHVQSCAMLNRVTSLALEGSKADH